MYNLQFPPLKFGVLPYERLSGSLLVRNRSHLAAIDVNDSTVLISLSSEPPSTAAVVWCLLEGNRAACLGKHVPGNPARYLPG
jgi:hypothetical protein